MANLTSPYAGSDSAVMRHAVSQVVESGQRLLADRLELAQVELKLGLQDAAERGATLMGAGVAMAVGFGVFTYGLVQLLTNWMPMSASALTVGGTYIVGSAAALMYAARRKPVHKEPVA